MARRRLSMAAAALLAALCAPGDRHAAVEGAPTYVDLEALPRPASLADAFRVSLVRPPGEPTNSGSKMLVNTPSLALMEPEELQVLDSYDALFEKYSLFCNGRWLGAQVLQDSQDLMYLQHITYMTKPDVILETGTYKGGLTYFFASLLDWIDAERRAGGAVADGASGFANSTVISVDRHHPDQVYAANWFCPVCVDCIRPYTTDVWDRKVRFIQGYADNQETYSQVVTQLYDLGVLHFKPEADSRELHDLTVHRGSTVLVNLDANHEFDGLVKELLYYAPLVTLNSYLVVQDTKLDKIWGTAGPTAALEFFLRVAPEGEFVAEPELKFHAYSQHTYLRRAQVTVSHTYFLERASELGR